MAGVVLLATSAGQPPPVLPPAATGALHASLAAADHHPTHVWRDTAPVNDDGTVNAYVEIPRGERRKYEFDMRQNQRAVDRVLPRSIGGYPVNYGFVPQTISYDGDPFDALVIGPALAGGQLVKGVVIGLMEMEDEKGLDSKVVLSPAAASGAAPQTLTEGERSRIAEYFRRYKRHDAGGFSHVPGWGDAVDGMRFVRMTHTFFTACRHHRFRECRVRPGDQGLNARRPSEP